MMRGPHREHSWAFSIQGGLFSVDKALNADVLARGAVATRIRNSTSQFDFGGAASLGKQLGNHVNFGVGAGFGTGGGGTVLVPTVDLTFSTDINKATVLFVPIGGSVTQFRGNGNRATSQWGVHGGLGLLKFFGTGNTALRIEGRMSMDRFKELKAGAGGSAFEGQGLAGLAFFMGGAPPRDTDVDGVPDKRDRCANTPRGAMVDANGCPRDSDNDHVYDGLDRCANTPANTPVDANGCPRDSDSDGVFDNLDRCPNTPAGTPVDANGCPRDADGDGVADNLDRCANTPRGTPVDANGCPRDADGDGVNDSADRCPGTPAGTPVDANGCPRDSDADGVNDSADRCPNTPAGTRVDPNGCPLAPDADRDGVEDARDRCPNTPAGRSVDANGCPLAELPQVGQSLVLRNINFASGSSRLLPSSNAGLDAIAASIQNILRTQSGARFEVGGYTDNRGVAAANRRLSQARAQSVVVYLTGKGIAASALTSVGYGPDSPKAPNTTAAGRAQNRRVEIKRLS
jgi:outer membrane protein OmpA-like peptidoglycan-associated protein